MGAPAEDPGRMVKWRLRQLHYDLSASQVVRQAQVKVAFRLFLAVSRERAVPGPSLLSHFRPRWGSERFTRIFPEILRQARAQGLGKDRVRLKDATPVSAHSAIPAAVRVVAQTREQVLRAAEGFAGPEVAAQRAQE